MTHCVLVGYGPGLGRSLARRFADEGFAVSALSRSRASLDSLGDLEAAGRVRGDVVDAGDAEQLSRVVLEAQEREGPADVLLYNAAGYATGDPQTVDAAELAASLAVNVVGLVVAAQAVLPGMLERGAGSILSTGGGAALSPAGDWIALAAGKAGQLAAIGAVDEAYRARGLRVASLVVLGTIRPGTGDLTPDAIADAFWALHRRPLSAWTPTVLHPEPG